MTGRLKRPLSMLLSLSVQLGQLFPTSHHFTERSEGKRCRLTIPRNCSVGLELKRRIQEPTRQTLALIVLSFQTFEFFPSAIFLTSSVSNLKMYFSAVGVVYNSFVSIETGTKGREHGRFLLAGPVPTSHRQGRTQQ